MHRKIPYIYLVKDSIWIIYSWKEITHKEGIQELRLHGDFPHYISSQMDDSFTTSWRNNSRDKTQQ